MIVEFAEEMHQRGETLIGAAVSSGAGTGIIGGTITATALAIFFVPLFYVLVRRMFPRRPANPPSQAGE
nr:efflux RND transporter permease subunit [Serratia marcescens]